MTQPTLHVIFGAGPLGMAVMEELTAAGKPVRMVSRSGRADVPPGVEVRAADASDPAQARDACQGAVVVYHCANTDYTQWTTLFPPLTRGILNGAISAGTPRLVFGDNLYSYGPEARTMSEDTPRRPVGKKSEMRAEMESLLLDADKQGKIEVAIAKGSDFYGPRVLTSSMGERVFPNLLNGKAASMICNPYQPHSYTYIRDFARMMVLLGESPLDAGQVWHVPSAKTISTHGFIQRAARLAGTQAKISAMPKGMLNILSLFVPILKELKEVRYQFEQPFIIDGRKAQEQLGFKPTPLNQALTETIGWYQAKPEHPHIQKQPGPELPETKNHR